MGRQKPTISAESPYQLGLDRSIKKAVSAQSVSAMCSSESPIAQIETSVMKILTDPIPTTSKIADSMAQDSASQELALARLIVETLNLDADAAAIDPLAPLFGEGLGLDSIDMLEIALAVSQTYGVKLRADDAENNKIFQSLASLSQYIQQHRI